MRTEERWLTLLPKLLDIFTPRIKKVIQGSPIQFDSLPISETYCYYIHGGVGSGKTITAALLALKYHKHRYLAGSSPTMLFTTVPDFFAHLKQCYEGNGSESEYMEKLKSVDLLILDDLGVEKVSEWSFQLLYMLINHRYEYQKPLIVTSNDSLDMLANRLGDDRITSRLSAMGPSLLLSNPDRRIPK